MGVFDKMRKVAGVFVEIPPQETESQPGSATEPSWPVIEPEHTSPPEAGVITSLAGQNLQPQATPAQPVAPRQIEQQPVTPQIDLTPSSEVDFYTIYREANLSSMSFNAEQLLDTLSSLPAAPMEIKQQMVKATLNAMGKSIGATPENIATDAAQKMAALDAYNQKVSNQVGNHIIGLESEIDVLRAEIDEKLKAIDAARQKQIQVAQKCQTERQRLSGVLEFFGQDANPPT